MPIMRDMFTTRIFLSALCKTTTAASNDQQSNSSSNTTPAYMAPSAPATLREHSRLIVKMIDLVVKNLDVENDLRTDTGSESFLKVGKIGKGTDTEIFRTPLSFFSGIRSDAFGSSAFFVEALRVCVADLGKIGRNDGRCDIVGD